EDAPAACNWAGTSRALAPVLNPAVTTAAIAPMRPRSPAAARRPAAAAGPAAVTGVTGRAVTGRDGTGRARAGRGVTGGGVGGGAGGDGAGREVTGREVTGGDVTGRDVTGRDVTGRGTIRSAASPAVITAKPAAAANRGTASPRCSVSAPETAGPATPPTPAL